MPETPEDLFQRVAGSLRMPPVEDWETFPFDGDMRPRKLDPPTKAEEPRTGAGGVDCWSCEADDSKFVWTNDRWRLSAMGKPSGLPLILILHPRAHFADPGDLPDGLAADLGLMLARVERAMRSIDHIGRIHLCRWGDGSEHLHWWFMARPERIPQLRGSFIAIWDDILPPTPKPIWRENIETVVNALNRTASG